MQVLTKFGTLIIATCPGKNKKGKLCGWSWALKKKSQDKKHIVCPKCKKIIDV